MGGPNLEVFKFGMYIMFPIGIMYYFGTNLDSRFSVPDFWPKEGQTHTIPFEKEDIKEELERLKQRRLAARARRIAFEQQQGGNEGQIVANAAGNGALEAAGLRDHVERDATRPMGLSQESAKNQGTGQKSWWGIFGR